MKMYKYLMAVVVTALFASCTMYQHTARTTSIRKQGIETNKTVVDVRCDLNRRVTATSDWCRTKDEAMRQANYNAIVENKIDIVVDPIYNITIKRCKVKGYKAQLTGLAGYFENPRTVTVVQRVQELNTVTREDIEKYLLLNNDNSIQYLYPITNSQTIQINTNAHEGKKAETETATPQQETPKSSTSKSRR